MVIILRFLLPGLFVWCLLQGAQEAGSGASAWELNGFGYLVMALFLALGSAIVLAPFIGEKIAEPLTQVLTAGDVPELEDASAKLAAIMFKRGWRITALAYCLTHSLQSSKSPMIPWLGLQNSRPGSWLEREFAWSVYGFNHALRCIEAYRVLQRHGIRPPVHPDPMVAVYIKSSEQMPKDSGPPVPLPEPAKPPGLQRDPRIRLFDMTEDPPPEPSVVAGDASRPVNGTSRPGVAASGPAEKPRQPQGLWQRLRATWGRS